MTMAIYKKQTSMGGAWVKAENVTNGTKCQLVSEVVPIDGQYGTQDVGKLRMEGSDEPLNVSLNKTTLNGLVDAFGEESKNWCNQPLTIQTERMVVSGRRVTVLYLVPNGYELTEDDGGYLVVSPSIDGAEPTENQAPETPIS